MTHTPTPWTTGDSDWHIIVGPSTRFQALNSSTETGAVTTRLSAVAGVFSSDNEAEDLANAAFIVKACNAHDELRVQNDLLMRVLQAVFPLAELYLLGAPWHPANEQLETAATILAKMQVYGTN